MSDSFRKQIHNNLNLVGTAELVEIWQTNDRVELTDMAFDVIREILLERLDELPEQNEPIYQHKKDSLTEEEVEASAISQSAAENEPVFYKPGTVLKIEKWLHFAAIAAVVMAIIQGIIALPTMQQIILSYNLNSYSTLWKIISWVIAVVLMVIVGAIESGILFFSLKALASILKILMELEFISREKMTIK